MSDPQDVVRRFSSLTPDKQLRVLAWFGHDLTIVGREGYLLEAPAAREAWLRHVNEIQHQVLAHIAQLLHSDVARYPDDVLLAIVFEQGDAELRAQSLRALTRALDITTRGSGGA